MNSGHVHNLELSLCLDDFRGACAARECFESVVELISKAKAAIHSAGAELREYSLSNTPNKQTNPRGEIASITFRVVTRYYVSDCALECKMALPPYVPEYQGRPKPIILINFRVKL